MPAAIPIPADEQERLERLRRYEILDTLPSEAFDRITRLASRLLKVPIAVVSLVDEDRQWFKSKVGIEAAETPREISFCAHAICSDDVLVVADARHDPRFAENPLVTGDPRIRFYAGAPLRSPDGHNMGALCVVDQTPRAFSDEDRVLLHDLARIVIDEMELHALAQREQQARNRLFDAIEALPDGFVYYDADDRLEMCNQRYREIYPESAHLMVPGTPFEEVIRGGVANGQYPAAAGNEEAWIRKRLQLHRATRGPLEQELPNGRWIRIVERRTGDGGLVGFRTDITELKEREFALRRLATTDPLTGAMNRRLFLDAGDRELRRARRYEAPLSIILLDVDFFKRINDGFGHAAGDKVLRRLVEEANATLREHDLVCRYGGEEFAVLFPETDEVAAEIAAERLRSAIEALEVVTEKGIVRTTISIGGTQIDVHNDSLESALSRADTALYAAKAAGRNRVRFQRANFTPLEAAL
ncbi:MAG: diguanylate cyclase [Kiloniellaceae bacterium]